MYVCMCVCVCLCVCVLCVCAYFHSWKNYATIWGASCLFNSQCDGFFGFLLSLCFNMLWVRCIELSFCSQVCHTKLLQVYCICTSENAIAEFDKSECTQLSECGNTLACPWERLVKPRNRVENLGTGNRGHSAKPCLNRRLENSGIYQNLPAWQDQQAAHPSTRSLWTNDPDDDQALAVES